MGGSIRWRITLIGVITLALVLGIGAWVTVRSLSGALRSDSQAQNEMVLDRVEAAINDGAAADTVLLPIGADGTEFVIFDAFGNAINASFVEFEFDESGEQFDELDFVDPGNWFETTRVMVDPGGNELELVAFTPFGIISRSVDRLAWTLAVVVPLLVLLGGLAIWFAIGAALRPVTAIAAEAARIAPSNSRGRLPVPDSGDEIASLTETLNDMLDRLDAGLIRQREFVSDASHELRSPLTAVKGASELLGMRHDLPAEAQPTLGVLARGAARLESVLDDLTQLADGNEDASREPVDVDEVISAEVTAVRDAMGDDDAARVRVESKLSPATIEANRTQLGRAVNNLLSNAVRHATSRVEVSTSQTAEFFTVMVDDDGPGVAPDQREHVFERFVRLDDGRSRSAGGSGLGLALVAAIAQAHGGSVRCEESPIGGARFVLAIRT